MIRRPRPNRARMPRPAPGRVPQAKPFIPGSLPAPRPPMPAPIFNTPPMASMPTPPRFLPEPRPAGPEVAMGATDTPGFGGLMPGPMAPPPNYGGFPSPPSYGGIVPRSRPTFVNPDEAGFMPAPNPMNPVLLAALQRLVASRGGF